jgi:tetratricopeptide (TPR) repeat protein
LDFKNEAVEDFMEAIDIQSMILGKSHPDVVKGFNNIGVYYNNLGFNEKAIECLLKSIEYGRENTERNDEVFVSSLFNVGNLFLEKGDINKAIFYLEECYYILINSENLTQSGKQNAKG